MDDRVNESIRSRARRNTSLLMRCMAEVSQKRVASLIGVSEPTLSEMKNGELLERFSALVAACGLKLVPITEDTYDESIISAMKTLSVLGLGRDLRKIESDE